MQHVDFTVTFADALVVIADSTLRGMQSCFGVSTYAKSVWPVVFLFAKLYKRHLSSLVRAARLQIGFKKHCFAHSASLRTFWNVSKSLGNWLLAHGKLVLICALECRTKAQAPLATDIVPGGGAGAAVGEAVKNGVGLGVGDAVGAPGAGVGRGPIGNFSFKMLFGSSAFIVSS